jgi:hypothetical protein
MRNKIVLLPLVALVMAGLACSTGGGLPLKDDFSSSSSGWSTSSGTEGAVEYSGDRYVISVLENNWILWGLSDEKGLSNLHIEITATDAIPDEHAGFGIVCHYQDDANFYYLGIGADSFYTIAKFEADEATAIVGDGWMESDKITANADSYRIGADCGNGSLALYVDGELIDSASDTTFSKGQVGVFALSADTGTAEVHFDDFLASALEE